MRLPKNVYLGKDINRELLELLGDKDRATVEWRQGRYFLARWPDGRIWVKKLRSA